MATHQLPQAEADFLASLYNDNTRDLPRLRGRVRELRKEGWTLRAIGTPLGVPRQTVRAWESHSDYVPATGHQPSPQPPNVRPVPSGHAAGTKPRVRAMAIDVPADDQARIRNLAPQARKVRGGTPESSPYRIAREELNKLVNYHYRRGVPIQRLAFLAGVSYRSMSLRIQPEDHAHAHAV